MEPNYIVTVRGTIPADLSEKVSRFHVAAVRNKKAMAAKAATGAEAPPPPHEHEETAVR